MKNYLLDKNPNFGEVKCTLKDDKGKEHHYALERVRNNGCVLSVTEDGVERDSVVFTMIDCRALFMLLTVRE
jgi:hypothetical protein